MTRHDWVGLASTVLEEGIKALVPGAGPLVGLASKALEGEKDRLRQWGAAGSERKEVADSITRWGRGCGFGDADIEDGMQAAAVALSHHGADMALIARLNLDAATIAAHVVTADEVSQGRLSSGARAVCGRTVETFYLRLVRQNRPDLDRAVQQEVLRRQELAAAGLGRLLEAIEHAPERLRIHIKPVTTVRERRTEFFVGRQYVLNAVDERLAGLRSGYVMVTGEPGIGKSAVLAEMVRLRGYVHHFNVATSGIRQADQLLRNLCAQLIVRYRLPYAELPADAGSDSDFLDRLLREAAAREAERPVVVVVDALDEAEPPSNQELQAGVNRLKLPADLPDGVLVVASIRQNVPDLLTVTHRAEPIVIAADDPRNLSDVRTYVSTFIDRAPEMLERISDWQTDREGFVELLTARSEGNFMYLVHVLDGIRTGELTPETVGGRSGMPTGLKGYYARHWRLMRDLDRNRFETIQRPVVCMLAAAPGPVTAAQVAEWITESGVFEPVSEREVSQVLRDWRQFFDEVPDRPPRWRIYHASFLTFLANDAEDVDLDQYRRAAVAATAKKIDWGA